MLKKSLKEQLVVALPSNWLRVNTKLFKIKIIVFVIRKVDYVKTLTFK